MVSLYHYCVSHSFGLQVVTEGVETKDQLEMLTDYDCDEAQGYYFYKPCHRRTGKSQC
ncbi:EAL domain-containing protein [Bacillus tuaregi]|uniref:EAL domain-containing protein n=1 Tax=Bacillus tuaregi TaxID=1816695 RepID=UPI0009FD5B89